jgi:hypothetical protein
MCWTTTQPNWLLVSFAQQTTKTRDDGQTLPNFIPLTTTESFGFYNLITLPNNQQPTSISSKKENKDSTDNHNIQPIYIAQNKLQISPQKNKNNAAAKYLRMLLVGMNTERV